MSEASQVSRYRPAVVAITGAAAAYGIYILYSTYSDHSAKSGLHRSNAVHRGRTRPSLPAVDSTSPNEDPSQDNPLGSVVVRGQSFDIKWDITTQGQPRASVLLAELGLPADQEQALQVELNMASVRCILRACFFARTPEEQQRLDDLGLHGLRAAITARDITAFFDRRAEILALLPEATTEQIYQAIQDFGRSTLHLASDDSDEMTYAETEDADDASTGDMEPSQGLKGLLYHIAEADAKRKAYEHRGIHCEGCGEQPIRGVRWHCLNCPDFDLCSTCEADNDHVPTHVFAKIKTPLPVLSQPTSECPLWYPGDPRKIHPPLKSSVKKQLEESYGFDGPQLDAHYDQFTCIANVPWPNDPNDINAAIDRRAFNKALTSERWSSRFRANLLYDKMFEFYDTNEDNMIGFEEFVSGLAYLRGHKRFTPLSRALQAFDFDGDGCVSREDFLRLFRYKHNVHRVIIEDMAKCNEPEDTRRGMDTVLSTQPISSVFSTAELPQGQDRVPQQKFLTNGDMHPHVGTATVLEDHEGWNKGRLPYDAINTSERHDSGWNSDMIRTSAGHARIQSLSRDALELHEEFEENSAAVLPTSGLQRLDTGSPYHPNRGMGSWNVRNRRDGTSQVDGYDSDATDDTLDIDVLWPAIANGYNQTLDSLFRKKEERDRMVERSVYERHKWSREIGQVIKEQRKVEGQAKQTVQDEPDIPHPIKPNMETADPLVAMAMASAATGGSFVPTDTASLTSREQLIRQQSLNQLLATTGYSTTDRVADISTTNGQVDSDSDTGIRVSSGVGVSDEHALNTPASSHIPPSKPEPSLSRDALEGLASLEKEARQIKERGGPGRLSFEEIEELVKMDPSRGSRGLVISWLEWASF